MKIKPLIKEGRRRWARWPSYNHHMYRNEWRPILLQSVKSMPCSWKAHLRPAHGLVIKTSQPILNGVLSPTVLESSSFSTNRAHAQSVDKLKGWWMCPKLFTDRTLPRESTNIGDTVFLPKSSLWYHAFNDFNVDADSQYNTRRILRRSSQPKDFDLRDAMAQYVEDRILLQPKHEHS